jgi:hypothetical protein
MSGDARTHCARAKHDCFFNSTFHRRPCATEMGRQNRLQNRQALVKQVFGKITTAIK